MTLQSTCPNCGGTGKIVSVCEFINLYILLVNNEIYLFWHRTSASLARVGGSLKAQKPRS